MSGVLIVHSGDLRGRKQMFTFSIFLMTLATLGIGLLPTYHTLGPIAPVCLLLLRIGQGAAVGGEVPGAWVLVSEHVRPARIVGPCFMIEAFPAPIRFTGAAFSYNASYAFFGGFTPLLVSWLLQFDHMAPVHYVAAVCVLGFGVGSFLCFRGLPVERTG